MILRVEKSKSMFGWVKLIDVKVSKYGNRRTWLFTIASCVASLFYEPHS